MSCLSVCLSNYLPKYQIHQRNQVNKLGLQVIVLRFTLTGFEICCNFMLGGGGGGGVEVNATGRHLVADNVLPPILQRCLQV